MPKNRRSRERETVRLEAAITRTISAARAAEPEATATVIGIAARLGADTARLPTRLKTRTSIADKLTRPGAVLEQAEAMMKDALRYTIVISPKQYAPCYEQLKDTFAAAGYTVVHDPGGWRRSGYRGLNLTLQTSDGYLFEVQLHTPASLRASDLTHPWYEEKRQLSPTSPRWQELQSAIERAYAAVPWPPGIRELR